MMADDEDYVAINADVLASPEGRKAVKVRCSNGVVKWIPRSLMFGPDEKKTQQMVGQLMEIRIFRWFAEKEGIPMMKGSKR